jgi:hypothetical protein
MRIETTLVWYTFDDFRPLQGTRVLVFTPNVSNEDKYRIVDGQFAVKCTDATHWAYLPLYGIN